MKAISNFKSDSGYRVNAHTMRTTAFRRAHGTRVMLALVAVSLFFGSALIAHSIAQDGGAKPQAAPAAPATLVRVSAGLIDHSVVATANRMPEPDASLLHSEPNAYLNLNAKP